jgi:hypothetical protein
MTIFYRGSGQYCYANSLSMALQSLEEEYDPSYLECMTAVSISAFLTDDNMPFFSSKFNAPDKGINVALEHLGYDFHHYYCDSLEDIDGKQSFQKLEDLLTDGAVITGPLDMGKLVYLPNHPYLNGVDHYVTVYKVDQDNVYLHDPAGYPFMSITREQFLVAWRAESIEYRIGSFSMWGNFRKRMNTTRLEQFQKTEQHIKGNLLFEKNKENVGPTAIRCLAEQLKDGNISDELRGHLSFFSFQLGAKRCSDFAGFYREYDQQKAEMKLQQGQTFGAAHVALMKEDWNELYSKLMQLAVIEEKFQALYGA